MLLSLAISTLAASQGTAADYLRADGLQERFRDKVYHGAVRPHWLEGGKRFWYRIAVGPQLEQFFVVDASSGKKAVIKDPWSIPELNGGSLNAYLPAHPSANGGDESFLSITNKSSETVSVIWVDPDGKRHEYAKLAPGKALRQHTYAGHSWLLASLGGRDLAAYYASEGTCSIVFDGTSPAVTPSAREDLSPDGQWQAVVRDHNVWLRPAKGGDDVRLTTDGRAGDEYDGTLRWSPDGRYLAAIRMEAGQEHKVYEVQSSPLDQEQPRLTWLDYLKPGDRIPHPRLEVLEVATKRQISADEALTPNPWDLSELHWAPDSSEIYFIYNQRGHQLQRLLSADATDGRVRTIVEETSKTFIDYSQKTWIYYLDRTGEAIWTSERSGYNHVYLVDLRLGRIAPITSGPWVVRSIEHIDPERREMELQVMGAIPGQDPYYFQRASVHFDGSKFHMLTHEDGDHGIYWSPDRSTFVDTYSRVDQPPITLLKRGSDGNLIATLESADISHLKAAGWQAPERFVAKGRDGVTNIFGIIHRPTNFDPRTRYPVIEYIYAGPHDFFVPKMFGLYRDSDRLAELGFIVVQIDGMGTNWRSKAFHDVCYQNLADAGFPDRIAWLKAAAKTRPWMDLSRVGIYGTSAGGQSAASAVMRFGDFYKAAVADCGCHDNRMDKIWWNEAWMGWPVGPAYAANSNVTAAKNLKGKLYLMVGELDTNVDPASTMQVVNALIQAGKDFDLLVVPNAGHGVLGKPYAWRRMEDFFVRNLWGKEPGH